jgi:Ca-activated chloride channel homolog
MAADQPSGQVLSNLEIIVDASGSMTGLIGDRKKIDIAHDALDELVTQLPDTANVALRAYGHRRGGDCGDTELVTPLGPLDRAALTDKINAIYPAQNGMTPIGASLQQVAEDVKSVQGDVLVVLVSDGDETCNGDPVQVATQLHTNNPKIKIDVIGFNVGPEEWRARLSGISQGGGGRYFDAADAAQLVAALQQSVLVSYHVLSADGRLVYQGALGSSATLPSGTYTVEVPGATPLTISDVVVGERPAVVELRQQDGTLTGTIVGQTAP